MNIKTLVIITVMITLTAILGVNGFNKYKIKTLNTAYKNNIAQLQQAISSLELTGIDYFHSPLYSEVKPENYDLKPGKFFKEILKISKYCGSSNGDCFAKKYTYENGQPYTPNFEGACAQLKTGPSICMTPQIENNDISGLIDVNGTDKPNVYGKDLRTFEIQAKKRSYNPDDDRIEAVKFIK